MSEQQPPATPLDDRIAQLVRAALATYPDDAGSVTCEVEYVPRAQMYFTEVAPARDAAAAVSLAFDGCWGGDTLHVSIGNTAFEWSPFNEGDLPSLGEFTEATLAGRVEEVSRGTMSFARFQLASGYTSVGGVHLPLPWRLRRLRRYQAYGSARSGRLQLASAASSLQQSGAQRPAAPVLWREPSQSRIPVANAHGQTPSVLREPSMLRGKQMVDLDGLAGSVVTGLARHVRHLERRRPPLQRR